MPVSVCPSGSVQASAETVWSFLAAPERFDSWWDAHVERVEPPGTLAAGQRIEASTRAFGRRFAVWFAVEEVDAAARRVRITAHLPLGLIDHATISVVPLDDEWSRLSFG
ncbi:MAG TPA: SRPBCC family protein [Polyangia bacterium]|jgi:hypothetical protein